MLVLGLLLCVNSLHYYYICNIPVILYTCNIIRLLNKNTVRKFTHRSTQFCSLGWDRQDSVKALFQMPPPIVRIGSGDFVSGFYSTIVRVLVPDPPLKSGFHSRCHH